MKRSCLLLFSLVFSVNAFGAACCGGGFAAPALIAGDDAAQITASYGYSRILDDVGADSLWRRRGSKETSETFTFEAAHVFRDRWQAGLSLPVVRRSRADSASTGLGDITTNLAYEYLPDWDYNPWRPKGLGYLQLTLPTGRSVEEANATYQLDSRGRGFWAAGLGTLLTKILGSWDVYGNFEGHRSFPKAYANGQSQGRLKPGWGGSLGGGGGYNFSALRLGAGLAWTYEDPVNVTGSASSHGSPQRFATASLSASYLFPENWAATLTYADQTLFGSPVNTSLGRGATLLFQKRWQR
jgi:hypothetical protein